MFLFCSPSPPFTHSLPPLRFIGRSFAAPPYCSGTAEDREREREREGGWASERWSDGVLLGMDGAEAPSPNGVYNSGALQAGFQGFFSRR